MTATALSNEFNILWDNIESGSAPGVDEYEKSIFFTIAQEMLITNYAPLYDTSEVARRVLANVTRSLSKTDDAATDGVTVTVEKLDSVYSRFYVLPSNLWIILHEHAIIGTKRVPIVPIKIDHFNTEIDNPFRKPSTKLIWRVDVNNGGANLDRLVELLSPTALTSYNLRYIIEPTPIITSIAITDDIREESAPHTITDPVIGELVHGELLNLAVDLAYKAFMDGRLKSQQ